MNKQRNDAAGVVVADQRERVGVVEAAVVDEHVAIDDAEQVAEQVGHPHPDGESHQRRPELAMGERLVRARPARRGRGASTTARRRPKSRHATP